MQAHFPLTAVQILWTLTFAAQLVLLVVLLGRDRVKRFPWFTASLVVMALRQVTSRLLAGRMPQLTLAEFFIPLAVVAGLLSLAVLVEMARQAFRGAGRRAWAVGLAVALAITGVVLWKWGSWPASWQSVKPAGLLGWLGLLQLVAQKLDLAVDVLAVLLGLTVAAAGRRFGAGWRSHVQRIVLGLSTAALAEIAMQAIWQGIATHTKVNSQADYEHVVALRDKLLNANAVVFVAALVWWIVCLWKDEPGSGPNAAPVAEPVLIAGPAGEAGAQAQPEQD